MLENERIVVTTAASIDLEKILLNTNIENLKSLSELKYLVAPLISRNKEDQETVYKILDKLDTKIKEDYVIPDIPNSPVDSEEEKEKQGKIPFWRLKESVMLIAGILGAGLIIFIILSRDPISQKTKIKNPGKP